MGQKSSKHGIDAASFYFPYISVVLFTSAGAKGIRVRRELGAHTSLTSVFQSVNKVALKMLHCCFRRWNLIFVKPTWQCGDNCFLNLSPYVGKFGSGCKIKWISRQDLFECVQVPDL